MAEQREATADVRPGTGPARTPPPFDSLANLRALGDIQRRGLEAANQVVGRLIDRVDRQGPLFGAEPSAATRTGAERADERGCNPLTQDAMASTRELMSSFVSALFVRRPAAWAPATSPSAAPADGAGGGRIRS